MMKNKDKKIINYNFITLGRFKFEYKQILLISNRKELR